MKLDVTVRVKASDSKVFKKERKIVWHHDSNINIFYDDSMYEISLLFDRDNYMLRIFMFGDYTEDVWSSL